MGRALRLVVPINKDDTFDEKNKANCVSKAW